MSENEGIPLVALLQSTTPLRSLLARSMRLANELDRIVDEHGKTYRGAAIAREYLASLDNG